MLFIESTSFYCTYFTFSIPKPVFSFQNSLPSSDVTTKLKGANLTRDEVLDLSTSSELKEENIFHPSRGLDEMKLFNFINVLFPTDLAPYLVLVDATAHCLHSPSHPRSLEHRKIHFSNWRLPWPSLALSKESVLNEIICFSSQRFPMVISNFLLISVEIRGAFML